MSDCSFKNPPRPLTDDPEEEKQEQRIVKGGAGEQFLQVCVCVCVYLNDFHVFPFSPCSFSVCFTVSLLRLINLLLNLGGKRENIFI